jgi:AmmeMemoRadiSam system protein B
MNINSRPAAVAGMFYPESAAVLARNVSQLLSSAVQSPGLHPKAIIAPHAGYVYSGAVAASIYACLFAQRGMIRRIVLLGPTHRVSIDGLALPATTTFTTPLGTVPIDLALVEAVKDMPQIVISDAAHAQEHSLEVQLPFLQSIFGGDSDSFSLLPLAVGHATPEQVAEVLERLWGGDETLIVVSTDLSHFLPYVQAQQVDKQTVQMILELAPSIPHQQACGATPVNGLLLAARRHGLRARLIDHCNSGDTAGDRSRVVGYGAFAFCADESEAPRDV